MASQEGVGERGGGVEVEVEQSQVAQGELCEQVWMYGLELMSILLCRKVFQKTSKVQPVQPNFLYIFLNLYTDTEGEIRIAYWGIGLFSMEIV